MWTTAKQGLYAEVGVDALPPNQDRLASKIDLRATGWDESSSRGRAGDTTTLRNAKFQLASH